MTGSSSTCALFLCLVVVAGCQPAPKGWTAAAGAVGPIRFGMTQSDVASALGMPAAAAPTVGGCRSWIPAGLPPGVRLMIEDGRVVRADIDSGLVRTREGAGIGSSEAEIAALYPGLVTQPHKYRSDEGWHYLISRPKAPADSGARIVFETDGRSVRSYRSGIEPAVEYVEGCG